MNRLLSFYKRGQRMELSVVELSVVELSVVELSVEQQRILDLYKQGKNIFITGPGGSGKSECIRHIYQYAKAKHIKIHVTALTGCAAILLSCNATTLHRWAGLGLAQGDVNTLYKKICESDYKLKNWKHTQTLIIDEVSMMSKKLFEMLNELGKRIRHCDLPFGGIQIIFSGDFYQLPPVGDKDDIETSQFCFESEEWPRVFPENQQILLTRIYRQQDDTYATMLQQIRHGAIKKSTYERLLQNVGKTCPDDVQPTKLFPRKYSVDALNQSKMASMPHKEEYTFAIKTHDDLPLLTRKEYVARSRFSKTECDIELEYLKSNLLCEQVLRLKVGAQVMCICNIEEGDNKEEKEEKESKGSKRKGLLLSNGSQGVVVRIDVSGLPVVKFNKEGKEMVMSYHVWRSEKIPGVGVSQIPLILSWAITIHKAQGMTLEMAEIDAGNGIFECGQTYVALPRVKSLEGLYLASFDIHKIKINKKVKEFYDSWK